MHFISLNEIDLMHNIHDNDFMYSKIIYQIPFMLFQEQDSKIRLKRCQIRLWCFYFLGTRILDLAQV